MKASWNGVVIAESDDTVVVEGNHYFPKDSIACEYFTDSTKTTVCPWKGTASYYTLDVNGQQNVGRRLVLPDAEGRGEGDHRSHRLLEGRAGQQLTARRAVPDQVV